MIDELKGVKYFKETKGLNCQIKSRGVFRTGLTIYDGAL